MEIFCPFTHKTFYDFITVKEFFVPVKRMSLKMYLGVILRYELFSIGINTVVCLLSSRRPFVHYIMTMSQTRCNGIILTLR